MIYQPALFRMGLFHLVISQSSSGDDDENTYQQQIDIDVTGKDDSAAGVHFESGEQVHTFFNSTNILIMYLFPFVC